MRGRSSSSMAPIIAERRSPAIRGVVPAPAAGLTPPGLDGARDARKGCGVSSVQRPFHRLAIVNRGEAAMRAIHAVRELNEEREEPIRAIALYTDVERHALFV